MISSSSSTVLVAELGGIVVGTLQLIVFRHLQHNGGLCAELESVHVDSELRSHGIGGVLVEAAVERARALGCYRVQLTSNEQRPDAHRFYERLGFTRAMFGQFIFPGPVDPARILYYELQPGARELCKGPVTSV